MKPRILLTAAFFMFVALLPIGAAETKTDSEFTTTAEKKSKLIEEGSDFVKLECPGMAGYKVIFIESDGRSWIELSYGGETTSLRDDTFNACPGMWPNKANEVVQWRGIRKGGKFIPYAVIFRMQSIEDEAQPDKTTETLVVIKLAGADSRVVGHVASNKGGNAGAEALADKLVGSN